MLITKKKKLRTSGPPYYSGTHAGERRKVTTTAENFREMDAAADAAGLTWAQWALAQLLRAAGRAR